MSAFDDQDQMEMPSQKQRHGVNREQYHDSHTPKKFRSLTDLYENTKEVEEEDELLLMGID